MVVPPRWRQHHQQHQHQHQHQHRHPRRSQSQPRLNNFLLNRSQHPPHPL
jgi:hypothetical protein